MSDITDLNPAVAPLSPVSPLNTIQDDIQKYERWKTVAQAVQSTGLVLGKGKWELAASAVLSRIPVPTQFIPKVVVDVAQTVENRVANIVNSSIGNAAKTVGSGPLTVISGALWFSGRVGEIICDRRLEQLRQAKRVAAVPVD